MKRLLILLLFAFPFVSSAQNIEVGVLAGVSGYQGDLTSDNGIFNVPDLHGSFGIFGRFQQNRFLSYRLSFTYGSVSASDVDATAENRRNRNLSFRSSIFELGLTAEFHFLGRDKRFSPFLFGGAAIYTFNPETLYQGRYVELQPLGTEGQGMANFPQKYSLTQFAIPLGVGVDFAITDRFNIGLEFGIRKLFTDYLDDVSGTYVNYNELFDGNGSVAAALGNRTGELLGTDPVQIPTGTVRGNPDRKDWYFVSGVTLSYNLFTGDGGGWGGKNQIGCPY